MYVCICEPVQEPPGQVLTKIRALTTWLSNPINEQVGLQVQVLTKFSPPVNQHICALFRRQLKT